MSELRERSSQVSEEFSTSPNQPNSDGKPNIAEELKRLTSLIETELQRTPTPALSEKEIVNGVNDDHRRRQVYSELELTRMDYEELPDISAFLAKYNHANESEQSTLKSSELGKPIFENLSQFDVLRGKLSMRPFVQKLSLTKKLLTVVRIWVILLWIILSLPILFLSVPFRLFHPLLRSFGIPNNFLPVDMIQKYFARNILLWAGVTVLWENNSLIDPLSPTVLMSNHTSNFDPFILGSGILYCKWIGKRSLFLIPCLGWLCFLWGHIAITRERRDKAIQSLDSAKEKIQKWARSVAVFPEGTRSKTGRIGEFKKGSFHVAIATGLPITPFLIFGAYGLWPPQRILGSSGKVIVKVLPRIEIRPGENYASLLSRVRRQMLKEYASPLSGNAKPYHNPLLHGLFLPVSYLFLYFVYFFSFRN